ncbi:hypothetical protein B0H13DRAFT_1860669 [Mycena leptocephala]|nr:hypothetical protein B0H13DRAFT_1860669 [Mycena leptocephala]
MARGRKTKFKEDQLEYLQAQYSKFEAAQRTNKLPRFWPKMEKGFFEKWPEEVAMGLKVPQGDDGADDEVELSAEDAIALGTATTKRKEQLHSWYNNQSQKLKKNQDSVGTNTAGSLAARLFKCIIKRRHRLQEVEIFQKRNKRLVDDAVEAAKKKLAKKAATGSDSDDTTSTDGSDSSDSEGDSSSSSDDDQNGDGGNGGGSDDDDNRSSGSNAIPGSKVGRSKKGSSKGKPDGIGRAKSMRLRRRIAQKLWENASASEKEIVKKLYREQTAHMSDDLLEKTVDERMPEEIQAAIDDLPGIIGEFHAGIYQMTGWMGATVLGGPTPEEDGSVTQKTYCSGATPAGLTLEQSLPDWETVIRGTGQWLKRCNPRELRRSRALKPKSPPLSSEPTEPPAETTPISKAKAKVGKNGLLMKPSKKDLKAAKAAKVAQAKALKTMQADKRADDNPLILGNDDDPLTFDDSPLTFGKDDDLLTFANNANPGDDDGADWLNDELEPNSLIDPIDPAIDPALLAEPAAPPSQPHTMFSTETQPVERVDVHLSPLVQEFGSLTGAAGAAPSYEGLTATLATFVYPPPLPPARATPTNSPLRPGPLPPSVPLLGSAPVPPTSLSMSTLPSPSKTPTSHPPPSTPATPTSVATQQSPPPAKALTSQPPLAPSRPTPRPLHSSHPPLASPGTPARHRHPLDIPSAPSPLAPTPPPSAPPPASISTASSASTAPSVVIRLSATDFPESRPMCNPPLEPKVPRDGGRGGRGARGATARGAARGGRGGGVGRGGGANATAGFTWMQTYDESGNIVPLPLDTPLPGPSQSGVKAIREREQGGDDESLELPEGSKRVRKPAMSRAMPLPLSVKCPKVGEADARAAREDTELLKRLQGSRDASKKRKATNENDAPPQKK